MLKPPIFVINCKAYYELSGRRVVELAKIADSVSKETGTTILIIPQLTDIAPVSNVIDKLIVFAPHLDPIRPGAFTGHVLAEALKEAGANGVMINHAERRLALNEIRVSVERARETGLVSMVCADTPLEARALAVLKPDIMVVEPPKLIGTGKAVSKVMREFTPEAVKAVKSVDPRIIVFTGAGITRPEDAEETIRQGAEGTGGSRFIAEARDKRGVLTAMAEAVQRGWESKTRAYKRYADETFGRV